MPLIQTKSKGTAYTIGYRNTIVPTVPDDEDPRGYLFVFEEPKTSGIYTVGCDPTVGITGWTRETRSPDDHATDNAAIQVIRRGKGKEPDIQVAEYAAPIDPEDLGAVLNLVGRLYGIGDTEWAGQAEVIIEVYPGPGLLTVRSLLNDFKYDALWRWQYIDSYVPENKSSFGWHMGPKSRRDLWLRCSRHLRRDGITMNSPALIEELAAARYNPARMASEAASGSHDDRWIALFLAIWAARAWSPDVAGVEEAVTKTPDMPDLARTDIGADGQREAWSDAFQSMLDAADD